MKDINFVVHSIDSSSTGGVLRVISDLANVLVERGIKVRIISLGPIKKIAFPLNKNIEICSLNSVNFDTRSYNGIRKIIWFYSFYKKIKPLLSRYHGIWITSSPPLCYLFSLLKRKSNVIINCTHTSSFYKKRIPLFGVISNYLLRRADATIALTKQDFQYYKRNRISTFLIGNGVSIHTNININRSSSNNKKFTFVGRFTEEKQPLKAVELFFRSKLYEHGYLLELYGYGELQSKIVEQINNYNINNYVSITNNVVDISEIYKNSFCLIMTSRIEGFGMVLLEAMSYNIPCIAYDCPYGPSNIIKNGHNGFLIPLNDDDAFLEKMTPENILSLYNNNISSSIEKFNINIIADKYISLFNNLA